MAIWIDIVLKILFLAFTIALITRAIVVRMVKEILGLVKLKKNGIFTNGIIIGLNEKSDLDGQKQYAKVIKFKTAFEKEIVFESHELFYTKPIIGKEIKVLYDMDNPNNAVEDFSRTFAFKLFLLFITSAILIVVTVGVIVRL